ELLAQDDEIEARLREAVSQETAASPLQSIGQLQRDGIPPNGALLEYYLGAKQSYLWVAQKDRLDAYSLPPRDTIVALAARVNDLLARVTERKQSPEMQATFERTLRRLSTMLLGPAGGHLPPRLIIVPDGPLHLVPFAALWEPGGGQRL